MSAEVSDRYFQEHVQCLEEGLAYSMPAQRFIDAAQRVASNPQGWAARVLACYDVFHQTERLISGSENPVPLFAELLDRHSEMMAAVAFQKGDYTSVVNRDFQSTEHETGYHYGNLFREFDPHHYYVEAFQLLQTRLTRNGFDQAWADGKRALDGGCGGGRYTVALRKLGFGEVVGLDTSEEGTSSARQRVESAGIVGVRFDRGSVLDMPYPDEYFDFVFSNGVLHHTMDLAGGVRELLRVLKKHGRGFLYLIENPGGVFWDVIEILRPVMKNVPLDFARAFFTILGVPANRRYYILDHIMVPVNIRSTPEQVEALLREAGAADIVRLKRGTDFDRVEQIHRGAPFHREKFGVGENRYFFRKAE